MHTPRAIRRGHAPEGGVGSMEGFLPGMLHVNPLYVLGCNGPPATTLWVRVQVRRVLGPRLWLPVQPFLNHLGPIEMLPELFP
jgi:hypothetical protein